MLAGVDGKTFRMTSATSDATAASDSLEEMRRLALENAGRAGGARVIDTQSGRVVAQYGRNGRRVI